MAELSSLNGLYVGQLSAHELATFDRAIAQGRARRVYSGAAGRMGVAKVEIAHSIQCPECGQWEGCCEHTSPGAGA